MDFRLDGFRLGDLQLFCMKTWLDITPSSRELDRDSMFIGFFHRGRMTQLRFPVEVYSPCGLSAAV